MTLAILLGSYIHLPYKLNENYLQLAKESDKENAEASISVFLK